MAVAEKKCGSNLVSEARDMVAKAEKKCRPSINHWKPMYSAAGAAFCQAALLLHQAGDDEEAKLNLLRACDCFKKKRAWYSAAKALEQAVAICTRQEDLSAMTELAWRSAALFRKAGQPDSAAQLLERASRALESSQPANSELMLEKAVETVETENRPIQAAWYVNKLLKLALKRHNLKQAVTKARKLVELYQEAGHKPSTGRSVLGLVLLLVNVNCFGEAELVAREFGNNCSKEQNVFIEDLLDAFDQNSADKLEKLKAHKCLIVLDLEYKPILEETTLPAHLAHLGARPRSRSRRHFNEIIESSSKEGSVKSENIKEEKKEEETPQEEQKEKRERKESIKREEKKSEKPKNATSQNGNEENSTKEGTSSNWTNLSSIRQSSNHRSERNPLRKSLTTDEVIPGANSYKSADKFRRQKRLFDRQRSNRECGSVNVDVGLENLEQHRPSKLNDPAVFVDVEGVEHVQPSYLGMSVEQWRAFKRAQRQEEEDAAYDELGYVGEEDIGDDFQ